MTEQTQPNLGTVSTEERDKFYTESKCVPTTCERALGLPRVVWIQKANNAKPFRSVIELGCHDGFSTRWLLNSAHLERLVGVELCSEAVEHANRMKEDKIFPELGVYIHDSIFSLEDAEGWQHVEGLNTPDEKTWEFPIAGAYDSVVCFELIEHFKEEESKRLLRLCHSLMSEEGRCFLTTPHIDGPFGKSNPDPAHIHFFDEQKLAQWIEEETGCAAIVINVQGILHALWRKDGTMDGQKKDEVLLTQSGTLTIDQLRDLKPPTVAELEDMPETTGEDSVLYEEAPLSTEQRLEALEAVAHAPVMDRRLLGLLKTVEDLQGRVAALEANED